MTRISDEAVEAAARVLSPGHFRPFAHVDPEPMRNHYRERAREALTAALPHLTDDGVAAPPADQTVQQVQQHLGSGTAAERATTTVAPSSPHPEWTEEERECVEIALAAADAGNAGHWPTVAGYLADEVRRLRAGGAS